MVRRSSASRRGPFTRSVKRDILTGGRDGTASEGGRNSSFARLLSRLRRLEFAMLYVMGERANFNVDSFRDSVLSLEADAAIESRGRNVRGSKVQVPHEGGASRQAARAPKNIRRPESRDGEPSPFAPGPPDPNEED